ncbi:MAG: hypothetical protein ABIF40_00015 [archaeon]
MNKRGQAEVLQTMLMFEIMLALLVAGILVFAAANFGTLSSFNEDFLEKDLSLLSSTVLASPGGITVVYPVDEAYAIEITDEVTVESTTKVYHTNSKLIFEKNVLDNKIDVRRENE